MTIRHALTMTTGLDWNEEVAYDDPKNDTAVMEGSEDWVQYVIDRPMAHEPGKIFNYSSGNTELLAQIFQKETGQDVENIRAEVFVRAAGDGAFLETDADGIAGYGRRAVFKRRRDGKTGDAHFARRCVERAADFVACVDRGSDDAVYHVG